jgi:CDP-paratose 2-epimerase
VIGFVEWLHCGRFEHVEDVLADLRQLNIQQLRTGISWADCYSPGGLAWYDWLIPKLAKELDLLPCITYTPPSIAIASSTAAPPKRLQDYADFVDFIINRYGKYFEYVELWNEPNNRFDWDFSLDPEWKLFSKMIGMAAYWVRQQGKKAVLGGMSPVDEKWINLIGNQGVLSHIDVVGIHGFPGTWDVGHWMGWDYLMEITREAIAPFSDSKIWITETGASTWCCSEMTQLQQFKEAERVECDRIYWYSLRDLHPLLPSQEGFHVDERHYHFGVKDHLGKPKFLFDSCVAVST